MTQIVTNKKESYNVFIAAGLILLSFLFYNIFELNFLFIIGIVIIACSLFLFDSYQLFLLFVLLLPNTAIRIIGESRTIIGYFFILVEIKFFILTRKATLPFCLFFHVVVAIITCVCYMEFSYFTTLLRVSVLLIFAFTFFNTDKAKTLVYQKQVLFSYVVGLAVNVVLGLVYYEVRGMDVFNGLFGGIENDRNYFSSKLAMGIGICILFMRDSKGVMDFLISIIMAFVLLLGGALSGSRTFLISLCVIFLQAIIVVFSIKKRSLKIVFILLGIVCIGVVSPLLKNILDRFQNSDALGGNNRLETWIYYLKLNFSSLFRFLFGNGNALKYIESQQVSYAEHNSYIQAFSTFGFLGTLPLVFVYIFLAQRIVENKKYSPCAWLPLCASLLCFLMISSLHSDDFNIAIIVGLLAVNVFSKTKEKEIGDTNRLY